MRYSLVKVLLTVSPFRPSFLQPPAVRPPNRRFFTPLFSTSSESLFSQLLCFHIYLRCPIVFFSTSKFPGPQLLAVRCFLSQLFCRQQLAASLSLLPLFFPLVPFVFSGLRTLFAKHPGWGYPTHATAITSRPEAYCECMDIRIDLDRHAILERFDPGASHNVDAAATSKYHCYKGLKVTVPGLWMKLQNLLLFLL
jgi:hypothetical protein